MPTCNLKDTAITVSRSGSDGAVYMYQADLGAIIENPVVALAMAQAAGPKPVPQRRALLPGTLLYVETINGRRSEVNRNYWDFEVQFSTPPEGEERDNVSNPNPLNRKPVYNVDYIEREYVVKQAKNLQAMGFNFDSGVRPANTLGPIVNAAFRRPDEPIVDTERLGVIVIERNYPFLGDIVALNVDYRRTTNSDELELGGRTIEPRQLKYLITRSLGRQEENGVVFYPGVTEIAIEKDTDLVLDNVGYEYWDPDAGDWARAKDGEGNDTAEPVNLKLDGTLKPAGGVGDTGSPVTITYRHLDQVVYAEFFA